MRGSDLRSGELFSYIDLEERVPGKHPLRKIRQIVNETAAASDDGPGLPPHVARNDTRRRSAIDGRTTRHSGYQVSQQKRKRIEEPFGWGKTIGGLARPMLRGAARLGFKFILAMAAYNLIRLPKLIAA